LRLWPALGRILAPYSEGTNIPMYARQSHACALVCLAIVSVAARPVRAAHRFVEYPVRPAGEYANKVVVKGFVVAVQPLEDANEQKRYFGTNLNRRGILPVLIVVQSASASDTCLLDRTEVGLGQGQELTGKGARRTASKLGSGGLLDLSLVEEVTDVRDSLVRRQLRSGTVAPGRTISGFVYVPIPTDAPRSKVHLQVPLTNQQSGETEVANLYF
jgi:hypothetical protein